MSAALRRRSKEAVREMFYFAYEAYLTHAYPAGELAALSCTGQHFDLIKIPAVTLVDTLDTLAILGNASAFRRVSVEKKRGEEVEMRRKREAAGLGEEGGCRSKTHSLTHSLLLLSTNEQTNERILFQYVMLVCRPSS